MYYFKTQSYRIYPNQEQETKLKELLYNYAYIFNKCVRKRQTMHELHGVDEKLSTGKNLPTRKGFTTKVEALLTGMLKKIVAKADKVADFCIDNEKPFPSPLKPLFNRRIDISDCPKSLNGTQLCIQGLGTIKTCKHEEIKQGGPVRWIISLDDQGRWMLRLLLRSESEFPKLGNSIVK